MGVDHAIDITTEQRKIVKALLRQHVPGTTAWAYGSRTKWTSRPQSDLDLVIFTTAGQNSRVGALREAFEESSLPFRVDLFVWDDLPEEFRKQIESDHMVLVEKNKRRAKKTWMSVHLGDVVDLLAGFPFKSNHYVNDPTAPRLLRGDNIAQGTLRWDNVKRWPREQIQGLTPYWLRRGDVVIAMDRPWIGAGLKYSSVRATDLPALLVQRVARLRGSNRLDTRFLNYVVGCRDFTEHVLSVQTGTAVPHISARQIKEFEFLLPPLEEQRAIAHILGTLDDKIELNRRMNETLEAMVRAMFQSWFVDFDPVRAKMEGRDSGLPGHIADLFPDRLMDSELGEIPAGWEVRPFTETVHVIGGGTPKTSVPEYWNGDIPWFSVGDAPAHSDVWVIDTVRKCSRMGIQNSSARILPFGTTIISARGTVGRVALVGVPMAMNQSCYGLRFKASTAPIFSYFTIRALVATLKQRTHGSVFNTITRDTLKQVSIVTPSQGAIEVYESLVRPALEQIRVRLFESRTLATLRDMLLPKLISGDLRVNAADHISSDTN